jgi:hypothetical protein
MKRQSDFSESLPIERKKMQSEFLELHMINFFLDFVFSNIQQRKVIVIIIVPFSFIEFDLLIFVIAYRLVVLNISPMKFFMKFLNIFFIGRFINRF